MNKQICEFIWWIRFQSEECGHLRHCLENTHFLCLLFLTDLAKILSKRDRIRVRLLAMKYSFLASGWKLDTIDMLLSGLYMEDLFSFIYEKATSSFQQNESQRQRKRKLFFSSEANIINLCCPWISNARASGIYTMGLVPETPLIHRRLTPNIAGYLSLHDIMVHSPNTSCLVS